MSKNGWNPAEQEDILGQIRRDITLHEFVDIEILQEIQDHFSMATGQAAIIVNLRGEPITKHSMYTSFCTMIHDHPGGAARCHVSDASLGRKASASGKTEISYCHAGLIDLAAPIMVGGIHVASVLCGQVLPEDEESAGEEAFQQCVEALCMDEGTLREARNKIPRIPKDRLHAAADLLNIISNYIVSMSLTHMNNVLLNEINMKVVEEQKTRIELEKRMKDSELKALQSQVNPHFLYNALNTIARLAMFEDAPKTEEVTFALADLLRHSLRKNGKLVSIGQEVEHIKKYLKIQEVRFSDRIQSIINIHDSIIDFQVPVMTLQPLVENAIVHGLDQKLDGGTIWINGYMKNGKILLEIIDDGVGIDEKTVRALLEMRNKDRGNEDFPGIGILNVYKQLEYYYGDQCGLYIDSALGKGTKITLQVM